jgi:hypothetical protein
MFMLLICVDISFLPLARETLRRHVVRHLLTISVPSMMEIWVAPESAIML